MGEVMRVMDVWFMLHGEWNGGMQDGGMEEEEQAQRRHRAAALSCELCGCYAWRRWRQGVVVGLEGGYRSGGRDGDGVVSFLGGEVGAAHGRADMAAAAVVVASCGGTVGPLP
ncbi:hypothetical protein PLESTB_001281100 [Pleodorina starrii]|uniref:Uncharacterized protein n=1 Tax=Pleodorina starrii TaxID=330485 RepID=A0A9W6F687_9CHLO|nr:hypothetical protein PLESTB_001281100 [Pleodorina starrii]GLC69923.1 hypothetical protein PLESTF_000898800 [Pleodorina starrii]